MRKNAIKLLAAGAMLWSGLACSNNDESFVVTNNGGVTVTPRQIVLRDDGQPLHPSGDLADTVELELFDASGNLIYGPVLQPLAPEMVFDDIPDAEVGRVEIDYLRNGGFLLYRATVNVGPNGPEVDIADADELPTDPNTTEWDFSDSGNGFELSNEVNGADTALTRPLGSVNPQASNKFKVRLKGVCYSPAPIQFKNVDAPSLGDLFWDTNPNVKNWFALWGKGPLPYDRSVQGRDDLSKIRAMGCNSIRTYCMISRQLFNYDANGNPQFQPGVTPVPPNKFDHFTHQQFLDSCWNNGNKPLYVLVGIPLPPQVLYRGQGDQDLINYWEYVLEETARDVGNHPAVLGFTLFNEIDENTAAWPGVIQSQPPTGGAPNADSDFYYGKLKQYSDKIKSVAPGKVVGWAAHDNQPFVYFGGNFPTPEDSYFGRMTNIDFYGVNTYHNDELEEPVLGTLPGRYGSLQGAARKPVILTEFGWPGVGHRNPNDVNSLYEDASTRQAAAATITRMIPKAYASKLVQGVFYFEFSDEWWKEPPYELFPGDTSRAGSWNGGPADGNMPNGFHDQEAFGLYSTQVGAGRKTTDPPTTPANRPYTPVDSYIPRTELIDALSQAYGAVQ